MKTKNKRELEKYWADEAKKASKKLPEKKATRPREDINQTAARNTKETASSPD